MAGCLRLRLPEPAREPACGPCLTVRLAPAAPRGQAGQRLCRRPGRNAPGRRGLTASVIGLSVPSRGVLSGGAGAAVCGPACQGGSVHASGRVIFVRPSTRTRRGRAYFVRVFIAFAATIIGWKVNTSRLVASTSTLIQCTFGLPKVSTRVKLVSMWL